VVLASPTPPPSPPPSPPLPPPSVPPLLLPLDEPVPPDDDPLLPLLVDPLELPEPAPHWHGSGWPLESHWVLPVRDPLHEHVSICPGEHCAPAELVLHPAGASRAGTAAKATAKMALMICMVTPCNPRVTVHSCHGRCR